MSVTDEKHYNYRRGTPFPRIGESEYYYNVWYKFTNPSAYKLKSPDSPENLIGTFARKEFNSVNLYCAGDLYCWNLPDHGSGELIDKAKWGDYIRWETRMFLDTNAYGSDGIYAVEGNSKLDELQIKVAEILRASGAVVDVEKMNSELSEKLDGIARLSKEAETLRKIIYRDSETFIVNKLKDVPESFANMSGILVKED